jgi:hypothetical protein
MRKANTPVLLAALMVLLVPASASAAWGNDCQQGDPNHCYALADYKMTGSGNGGGEEVMGLSSEIATTAMNVPQWEYGAYVTNEQWMAHFQTNRWIEDGQQAGEPEATEEGREVNGQSLHWFYAFESSYGYSEYVAPWTYPGFTFESYTLSDPGSNGTWCEKIGEVQVACQGGFPKYATEVQVGMEAADEVRPSNSGKDHTGVQWTEGNWHHWAKARLRTFRPVEHTEEGVVCASPYESIPGYINFGTC